MAKMTNTEKYVKGRRAGVAHNQNREIRNGTPKTIPTDQGDHDISGSQDRELSSAASRIYQKSVKHGGHASENIGDQAVKDR